MAAVIRVKRRIDEEPLNAFVLNCKRRKVSPENAREAVASSSKSNDVGLLSSGEEKSTILKFAGTVESQDESHITKMTKEEAKELMGKTRIPQPVARARDSHRLKTQEERFRIVNCSRAVDSSGSGEEKPITILDIEKQSTLPAAEETAQSPSRQAEPENRQGFRLDFVYDLYVSELGDLETDIDDGMLENQLSIRPFDCLAYGSRLDNGLAGRDSDDEESSDDSNDENNWRNDYPDTDPDDDSSIDERDMRRAVKNFNLDDDSLSTDDEDNTHTDYYEDYDDPYEAKGRDYERYHRMLKLMSQNNDDDAE
ncbi:probable RNA polymerase II nuclear localization protein SLC7A6OS isoform X1 [Phlebotomus argentipes]|uniref:probable RNA polymerase II nuclear localization protein SLC7A6OS isoform X1 n=1 Tax=Phlebotomus argentipes TaxID=94469 RepID=UPI0028935C16|nr:probable RNA polymerase II nuclear localization protein SLC7A6OS isoform X1 [Phlebotomus argentipes]